MSNNLIHNALLLINMVLSLYMTWFFWTEFHPYLMLFKPTWFASMTSTLFRFTSALGLVLCTVNLFVKGDDLVSRFLDTGFMSHTFLTLVCIICYLILIGKIKPPKIGRGQKVSLDRLRWKPNLVPA